MIAEFRRHRQKKKEAKTKDSRGVCFIDFQINLPLAAAAAAHSIHFLACVTKAMVGFFSKFIFLLQFEKCHLSMSSGCQ